MHAKVSEVVSDPILVINLGAQILTTCLYVVILGIKNALETIEERLSNASKTLDQRPTSSHDVFIHCGSFHGQWARRCGALLARVRVCLATAVCDR
jgi:hypothetical protein